MTTYKLGTLEISLENPERLAAFIRKHQINHIVVKQRPSHESVENSEQPDITIAFTSLKAHVRCIPKPTETTRDTAFELTFKVVEDPSAPLRLYAVRKELQCLQEQCKELQKQRKHLLKQVAWETARKSQRQREVKKLIRNKHLLQAKLNRSLKEPSTSVCLTKPSQ